MKLSLLTVALRALPVLALASLARGQIIIVPAFAPCEPPIGTGISCPCGNGNAQFRGCNNSFNTGGAFMYFTGSSSLSADTLVLFADGMVSGSVAILIQGDTEIYPAAVFGQGVRCVGGNLRRMYSTYTGGGSVRMPPVGQMSISARSAAVGDPIAPGTMRYYQVAYRDLAVLGGCPMTSAFNISTGMPLIWAP